MILSNDDLAVFERLRIAGLPLPLVAGTSLARGYADLGFEQFLILPGMRLLSLFRGTITELTPDILQFGFVVLSVDELVSALESRERDILSVRRIDARRWTVELSGEKPLRKEGTSLQVVLAGLLLEVLS